MRLQVRYKKVFTFTYLCFIILCFPLKTDKTTLQTITMLTMRMLLSILLGVFYFYAALGQHQTWEPSTQPISECSFGVGMLTCAPQLMSCAGDCMNSWEECFSCLTPSMWSACCPCLQEMTGISLSCSNSDGH